MTANRTPLRRGDVIEATRVVHAPVRHVFRIVSDPTRFPEWSPECVRCTWLGESTFRGWNRRRFGRWSTTARVVANEQDREFTFIVKMAGKDFTRWSYLLQEGGADTVVTERFSMVIDLPAPARWFEVLALGVRDRQTDLKGNLDRSLRGLAKVAEDSRGGDTA